MSRLKEIQFTAKNGKRVLLRSPDEGEAEELLNTMRSVLEVSPYTLTQADEFTYTVEQEKEMIRTHNESDTKLVIVPVVDGKIGGMLNFSTNPRRRNSHSGEFGVSLVPELQGLGIGEKMVQALLDWGTAAPKVERIYLRVHSRNVFAVKLYEKLGFAHEGREIRGVKLGDGQYDDVLLMAKLVG